MSLAAGSRLGPYEIVTPLCAGGMGEVYRARDTRLHRDVVLKVLPDAFAADPDRVRRFQQEARAVAALSHPHICQIFDVGPDYLVLEYVEGTPLRGPLPERDVIRIALQIASALQVAHARGILHRDLKPANVLITRARGSVAAAGPLPNHPTASHLGPLELPTAKLLDFGIAKQMTAAPDETQTVDGVVVGTAAYMSPEQATGSPSTSGATFSVSAWDTRCTSPGKTTRRSARFAARSTWIHGSSGHISGSGRSRFANASTRRQSSKSNGRSTSRIGIHGCWPRWEMPMGWPGAPPTPSRSSTNCGPARRRRYVSAYSLALVYAGLGMRDRVIEHLDKAIDECQPYLILLKVEPPFLSLHSDTRFQQVLRRIGFSTNQ